jgi:antitoxin component YwqK of YwqJK toxin-antitoxin module
MRNFLLLFGLVVSPFLLSANVVGVVTEGPTAIEQEEGEINKKDPEGKKQGPWIIFGKDLPAKGYPAEGKIEEGPYKDDRKNGKWTMYHKDGMTPRVIGEFVNGRPKGAYQKMHVNGTVKEEGVFVNRKQQGSLKRYYEDGSVSQDKSFNAEGKEEGPQKLYYPNGQVEVEYVSKNGVKTGEEIRYTPEGKIKQITTYGADGEILSKDIKDVEPVKVEVEVGGGGPSGAGADTKGKAFQKDGYNKLYNSDEELWMDGKFKSGKLWDGKLYKYDSDGILLKIEIWKNGKYHSDGQL